MPRKRYKPEEIVTKLRQVDVLVSQGSSVVDAIRQIAPLPRTVYSSWQQSGALSNFEAHVGSLFESKCKNTKVFTNYGISVVPDVAMRDADHLVRHDWTNFYAVLLNDLILSLD